MVISHNLQAMNTGHQLGLVTKKTSKSQEKLSSGYRINRASDDAAGLAISEKMRAQIRGLDKASTNASDGISVVQTAEGALNEIHAMLGRMNELATQAANDTNTSTDRSQLQLEINQLMSEIDRVSSSTQFNTMNLLDGSFTGKNLQVGALSGQKIEISIEPMSAAALGLSDLETTYISIGNVTIATTNPSLSVDIDDDSLVPSNETLRYTTVYSAGSNTVRPATGNSGSFTASLTQAGAANFNGVNTDRYFFWLESNIVCSPSFTTSHSGWYALSHSNGNQITSKLLIGGSQVNSVSEVTNYFNTSGTPGNKDRIIVNGSNITSQTTWLDSSGNATDPSAYGINISGSPSAGDELLISNSAGGGNAQADSIFKWTEHAIKVDSFTHAGDAMDRVQNAIDKVSTQRAKLGAIQNRLEHTIANLDITSENTQNAESRIRDTDMAKEMVQYSIANILSQAGQSMLAQANQSAQGVLSLLQ